MHAGVGILANCLRMSTKSTKGALCHNKRVLDLVFAVIVLLPIMFAGICCSKSHFPKKNKSYCEKLATNLHRNPTAIPHFCIIRGLRCKQSHQSGFDVKCSIL